MKIGLIGLGKMGFPMADRLLRSGIKVVAYNRSSEKVKRIAKKGAIPAYSIEELVKKLPRPRIVWLMLPGGQPTDEMVSKLGKRLSEGDVIINGANDFYKYAQRHAKQLARRSIHYFDCGVSGGIWGNKNGFTLMVGGPKQVFRKIEPALKALAPKKGYGYFGEVGAGHFVKSVHNCIEYVYLQGLAEGVELLDTWGKENRAIDIKKAVQVWQPASVIRSWLLDLAYNALSRKDFNEIGTMIKSVTIKELEQTIKSVKGYAPAFEVAAQIRKDRSNRFPLGKRTIAALRREFGGHSVEK
ncbi:MAG TPA: NADP-dependent phosphogluconate dehydrogenase [Candidatus Nanoarchaeia archaeon]|nr:NADP-dependent phosphogluconate dehydrogenase [Candidatus Nanoarchaeia archaeon]